VPGLRPVGPTPRRGVIEGVFQEILTEEDAVPGGVIVETDTPGIFAGGDIAKAPGSIVDAIAAGRRAARSIDTFLGGDGDISDCGLRIAEFGIEGHAAQSYTGKRDKGFADLKREPMPALPVSERHDGFGEVELGFTDDQAKQEAKRCLQCDLELNLAQDWIMLNVKT
jgi:formate dehydrogenase beta subunit